MIGMGLFTDVYFPGPNINDHAFLRAGDRWHLFHIWMCEDKDHVIGHATSEDLRSWQTEPDILPKDPEPSWESRRGGNAPYVFAWEGGDYLYYSRYDQHPILGCRQQIGLATSRDLSNWRKHPDNPVFHPAQSWCPWGSTDSDQYRPHCCRDPHVIRVGDQFVLYYVAMSRELLVSAVAHAVSDDLVRWEDRGPVATMPVTPEGTRMCESPCVVRFQERWLLFFTHGRGTHCGVSDSPFEFGDIQFLIPSHASEVFEWDGRWYISHCGHGGLSLAGIDLSNDPPTVHRL